MYIIFEYRGNNYKAILNRTNKVAFQVTIEDDNLGKEFGKTLHFQLSNNVVEFQNSNRCHSNLYALKSSISKAIQNHLKKFSL